MLPQCPRGLMLDYARHTSHCESNFGSFCRGCPTQRSRVPSSVSWVDSSRLRSCSVAASRLGFYLVSPPSSRLGSGPRLVASSRVGLAGGSWWLAVAGWCLAVSLGGSGRLAVASLSSRGGSREACDGLWGLAGVLRSPCGCSGRLAVVSRRLGVTRCGSWWLVVARGDWLLSCGLLADVLVDSRVVLRLSSRVGLVGGSRLAGASRFLGGRVDSQSLAVTPGGLRRLAAASRGLRWVGAILRLVSWVPWGDS